MAWRLAGQLIETCNCNMFCPCWYAVPELMKFDQDQCSTAIALRMRQGDSDGVDLGGRTAVMAATFPGPTLFDGKGTGRVYVDDGADDRQRRELEEIVQGKKGGPMATLAPLISTWRPTRTAKMDVKEEGDALTISVGQAGEVKSTRLRDGQGNTFSLSGGGFVAGLGLDAAEMAPSASVWDDREIRTRFETKSGARGNFNWSG